MGSTVPIALGKVIQAAGKAGGIPLESRAKRVLDGALGASWFRRVEPEIVVSPR